MDRVSGDCGCGLVMAGHMQQQKSPTMPRQRETQKGKKEKEEKNNADNTLTHRRP